MLSSPALSVHLCLGIVYKADRLFPEFDLLPESWGCCVSVSGKEILSHGADTLSGTHVPTFLIDNKKTKTKHFLLELLRFILLILK